MKATVAYFSMEIGLNSDIHTYSGGLGILAGDTIRSAADLGVNMVAVTLMYHQGYFRQTIDKNGWQEEAPDQWLEERQREGGVMELLPQDASITIEGRPVKIRIWKFSVHGIRDHIVPVYLLDTDVEENDPFDRSLSQQLYGGDNHYRLCQEVLLGIGGVKVLRALDYTKIRRFHMNEGHAAFLIVELLTERMSQDSRESVTDEDLEAVRNMCVFTTHTPVPAGHDVFPEDLVSKVLRRDWIFDQCKDTYCINQSVNMTYLALDNSNFINGVAKKHREVSEKMFPDQYEIEAITNGVHAGTWTSQPMQQLFDEHIPGWREDNASLRYAIGINAEKIWQAHQQAKQQLLDYVNVHAGEEFSDSTITLGYARRATQYKRPDLLFTDIERLNQIANTVGPMQIIFAGKAHPHDQSGKELIQKILKLKTRLDSTIKLVYLINYDMALGKLLTAGTDLWLNTPQPPLEASGTSGMKAAVNGVPSLSVLDGWWIEGCIEGITGWSIGNGHENIASHELDKAHAYQLYEKLEQIILPMYYKNQNEYIGIMRHAIGINASFFNTERMLNQYVTKAYL